MNVLCILLISLFNRALCEEFACAEGTLYYNDTIGELKEMDKSNYSCVLVLDSVSLQSLQSYPCNELTVALLASRTYSFSEAGCIANGENMIECFCNEEMCNADFKLMHDLLLNLTNNQELVQCGLDVMKGIKRPEEKEKCEDTAGMVGWRALYATVGLAVVLIVVVLAVMVGFLFVTKQRMVRQVAAQLDLYKKQVAAELKDYYDSLLKASLR